jgi:hypothetical protein
MLLDPRLALLRTMAVRREGRVLHRVPDAPAEPQRAPTRTRREGSSASWVLHWPLSRGGVGGGRSKSSASRGSASLPSATDLLLRRWPLQFLPRQRRSMVFRAVPCSWIRTPQTRLLYWPRECVRRSCLLVDQHVHEHRGVFLPPSLCARKPGCGGTEHHRRASPVAIGFGSLGTFAPSPDE